VQLCLIIVLLLATASGARAGAFTLPEGEFVGMFGAQYFNAYHTFNENGHVTRGGANLYYRDITGFVSLDAGVTDNFEFHLLLPGRWQYLSNDFDEHTSFAISDLTAEGTVKLAGGQRAAIAVTLLGKFPMFYDRNATLPAGDGQIDLESRLLTAARASFFTFNLFGGYRVRFGEPADIWRYGGSINFNYSIVFGGVGLDGYASARNQEKDAVARDFMHGPDYALGLLTIELGLQFTQNLGAALLSQYTAYGRNAAYGGAYTLSLIYSF
jgi:hypothetical protein